MSSLVVSRYHLRQGPPPQLIEPGKVEELALSHESTDADLVLLEADPEPGCEDGLDHSACLWWLFDGSCEDSGDEKLKE